GLQHEPPGGLLGQRADGELLRLAEEGVGPRRRLRHPGRSPRGHLRVHRSLLQRPTSALLAGVRLPGGVRTNGIKLNSVSTFRGELHSQFVLQLVYAVSVPPLRCCCRQREPTKSGRGGTISSSSRIQSWSGERRKTPRKRQ